MHIVDIQGVSPRGFLMIPKSSEALQSAQERQDPGWGWGTSQVLSRQLSLSRKQCSELWGVKQLKANAFNSKEKKKLCLFQERFGFIPLASVMVVNTAKGMWAPPVPHQYRFINLCSFCFPPTYPSGISKNSSIPTSALNNSCVSW